MISWNVHGTLFVDVYLSIIKAFAVFLKYCSVSTMNCEQMLLTNMHVISATYRNCYLKKY